MIIQKILEKRITLTDSKEIYSQNPNATYIKKLSNDLVGKCFQSCYILKINKIIRTSQIYMSDQLNGSAYINIRFMVEAIIYNEKEIIPGCKIRQIESGGQIYADSKYARIQIINQENMKNRAASILKIDDIVPVITYKVSYGVAKDKISVVALAFTPIFQQSIIYKISESKDPIDKEYQECINQLYLNIKDEENNAKELTNTKEKAYDFFKKLLYPFKEYQAFSNVKEYKSFKFNLINFEKLKTLESGYISRPIQLEKDQPSVYYSNIPNDVNIHNLAEISENSLSEITILMLQDYLQHLITLREFVEQYPDIKTISKYADIWKLYNMLKK